MSEPVRAKTLDGEVRLWPDGLELVFTGVGAAKEKKAASPVRLRLSEIAAVELEPPHRLRRGVLRLRPTGFSDNRPRPEKDPLCAVVSIGKQYEQMVVLCRELQARGVSVEGLPPMPDPVDAAPTPTPTVADAPVPEAPTPAASPMPTIAFRPVPARYDSLMKWQVRLLSFQLFMYGLGALLVLGFLLFIVVVIVRA